MKAANYKDNAIESVLSEFDFDRVVGVMRKIEWTDHDSISSYSLIKLGRELLNDAWELAYNKQQKCSVSSRGLEATANWDYGDGMIYSLVLKFVVTQWECKL